MAWIEFVSPELNMVGAGNCREEVSRPVDKAPDHLFLFIQNGTCELVINDTPESYGESEWLILPPGTKISFAALSDDFFAQWINFNWFQSCPGKMEIKAANMVPDGMKHGTIGEQYEVGMTLDIMQHRWRSGNIRDIMTCKALLLEVLIRLLADWPEAEEPAPGDVATVLHEPEPEVGDMPDSLPEDQLALLMKRLLDDMPPNQYSIGEALSSMSFSYEYMEKLFRKYYYCSPLEYLMKLRVEQSARKTRLADDPAANGMCRVEHAGGYYSYEMATPPPRDKRMFSL